MSKIKYLKHGSVADIKANVAGLVEKYGKEATWLDEHFGNDAWFAETKHTSPENITLKMPDGIQRFDAENAKIIYSAFMGLPLTLAIDERFWSYLTHVVFWDYMRKRWPIENALQLADGPVKYLREHYFFMGNRDRALIRNGISRLWWYGYISHDATRENPFELTEVLLEKLDIAQQLLERSYSRNGTITKTILSMLVEKQAIGEPFSHRSLFRPVVMHLNAIGGVTILDALIEDDIREIVNRKLAELQSSVNEDTGSTEEASIA
jgi:hypothetical protein